MQLKWYFYVDFDNKVHNCQTDNETEIQNVRVRFGNVFFDRQKALDYARKPKVKVRRLTPQEQKEQYLWALSMMTEEERNSKPEKPFNELSLAERDRVQLEFARQMMGLPTQRANYKRKNYKPWYKKKRTVW